MAESDKSAEESLEAIQQHIVDVQQEGQDSPQIPGPEESEKQVSIIIAHADNNSNITKEDSLSPKSLECHSVGVQTQTDPQPLYNVIPDDGSMGYDDGVRVLRAIGTWAPEYSGTAQFLDNSSQGFVTGEKNGTSSTALNGKPVASSTSSGSSLTTTTKTSSGEKSFQCPVCHKGLARKDKLVIHMRIHTGEKPYVCEVCDKAFARRDKLVMHMNKLKHLTPTNIAPLGKRPNQSSSLVSLTPVKKPAEIKTEKTPAAQSESLANELRALGQPRHVVAWSCEICGRLCSSRDEWAAHAKSHLNVGDVYNLTDRHVCMICRQEFTEKSDLAFHMRQHLTAKGEQIGMADLNSICS